MEIQPKQHSVRGPADWFTGDVWIDAIAGGREPSHLNAGAVHFSPGARTAWHWHEGGQTLYITEGRGPVQSRGDRVVEVRSGDVIYTPDHEEHWHGTAPDHFMTHLSLTEGDAHWGIHVTDAEYRGQGAA
jgi:quercetin dioxygenase-like cupin family protein